MPYIAKERRQDFSPVAHGMPPAETVGDLNFQLTEVINHYMHNLIHFRGKLTYGTCNDIIGAIEACKLEFYRRVVAPMENDKIEQNGDCY